MDVRVEERSLGRGLCGLYCDALRLVIIDDRLLDHQKVCTLCHELVHARHRDPGCGIIGAKAERRARKETALWLVDPDKYASAERVYDGDSYLIACELGVTVQVIDDYRQILRDSLHPYDGAALHGGTME